MCTVPCSHGVADTPLMRAALASALHRGETARLLLDSGASTVATDRHGNTPLHLCALGGVRLATLPALCPRRLAAMVLPVYVHMHVLHTGCCSRRAATLPSVTQNATRVRTAEPDDT